MKNLILSVFVCTLVFSGCAPTKKEKAVDPDAESKRAAIAILKKLESYTEVGISLNEFSSRLLDINAELNAAIEPIQDPAFRKEAKDICQVYADSKTYWTESLKSERVTVLNNGSFLADYDGYPDLPKDYDTIFVNKFWTIAQRKRAALEIGPGSYTFTEKLDADTAYREAQQALKDQLAAEEEMLRLEKINNAIENKDYKLALTLDPQNAEALAMKKEADIANALAKGDFKTALKLEPTNEQALAMQADSNLKIALDNGDYESALKMAPANEQALAMKNIKVALDNGDYKAALKIDPNNKTALSMKTAAYVERLKNNVLVIPNVHSLAYSPDGRDIAVIAEDRRILILDSKTGDKKTQFLGAIKRDILGISFSPDGESILTGSASSRTETPKIWSLKTRRISGTLKANNRVYDKYDQNAIATYNPDGNHIVTAQFESNWDRKKYKISIWDSKTLKEKVEPIMWPEPIVGLTFSPDGENIILQTSAVDLLDAQTLEKKFTLNINEGLTSIAYSPDGESIVTSLNSAFGSKLKLWDAQTGKEKYKVQVPSGKVLFSPDGENIILIEVSGVKNGGRGGEEDPSGGEEDDFGIRGRGGTGFGFGESELATKPGQDTRIIILDAKTGKEKASFKIVLPVAQGFDFALSPDGNSIAIGTHKRRQEGGGKFSGGGGLWGGDF